MLVFWAVTLQERLYRFSVSYKKSFIPSESEAKLSEDQGCDDMLASPSQISCPA
jgi:hypothetical protein